MIRAIWNSKARSYTVNGKGRTVRGVPTMSQVVAVKMDIRYGWPASFGKEE